MSGNTPVPTQQSEKGTTKCSPSTKYPNVTKQPSSKSSNLPKSVKWLLIGVSLLIVMILVESVCNGSSPQMAARELEEQGIMPCDYTEALFSACEKNDVKKVSLLITAGADVNRTNVLGLRAPLHGAALAGHTEIVKLLIEAGADVNKAENCVWYTPLLLATQEGHTEIVKLLEAAGTRR